MAHLIPFYPLGLIFSSCPCLVLMFLFLRFFLRVYLRACALVSLIHLASLIFFRVVASFPFAAWYLCRAGLIRRSVLSCGALSGLAALCLA